MKKPNLTKGSGKKKIIENDELKKPVKLKPDNKKASKNWKNNLFDDDDDFMFNDLKLEFDDDFEEDFEDDDYEYDDDDN